MAWRWVFFLLLFRDIIRKNIFSKLPAPKAYKLLRLIGICVWSVAIVGIAAWVYTATFQPALPNVINADCGIAIGGNVKDSNVSNSSNCPSK